MARDFLAGLPTYVAGVRKDIRDMNAVIVEYVTDNYGVIYGQGDSILKKVGQRIGKNVSRSILNISIQTYRYAFRYLIGSDVERKALREMLDRNLQKHSTEKIFSMRPACAGLYAVITDRYEFGKDELERLQALDTKNSRKRLCAPVKKQAKAEKGIVGGLDQTQSEVAQDVKSDGTISISVAPYLAKQFKVINELFTTMQQELARQVGENNRLLAETEERSGTITGGKLLICVSGLGHHKNKYTKRSTSGRFFFLLSILLYNS
ncbi:MAG: hypothetical protein G01um101429_906 [Parcubacteria group bacterium Gr01-1014_29]|nr:MAG: hypothetical protein G01um101429_906 [Parcubacteria group bacterium Gr01-1014_29]